MFSYNILNVGVIGLGMMGSQIALRLALKGHKVTVFNRDTSKIEKLLAQHTNGTTNLKMAHKPKELAETSDIAIICVKDYRAITNVSFMTGRLIETQISSSYNVVPFRQTNQVK